MKTPDDPILNSLADLPEVPLDPAAADAVRRSARAALVDGDGGASRRLALTRLSIAWSTAILPAILLGSGAAYTWGAVQMMGRIFVG